MSDQDWRDRGACAGKPNHWFFPPGESFDFRRKKKAKPDVEELEAKAIAVCADCPVIAECRAWGVAHEAYGVWGGLTSRARAQLRHKAGLHIEIGGSDETEAWRHQRAVDLWRRRWPVTEIAEELGETTRTIHRWLDAAGIEATPPPDRKQPRRRHDRMSTRSA